MATQGKFAWFDYYADDAEAARTFYSEAFGWKLTPFDGAGGDGTYLMFTAADGVPVGGSVDLPPEAKEMDATPYWLSYIETADIEATLSKATSLGAQVVHQEEMPTVGKFAVLLDPQGAAFATIQPAQHDDGEHAGPGHCSWHDYMANDWEAAFEFYAELFDWVKTDSMQTPSGTYQMFGRKGAGQSLGGFLNRGEMSDSPSWLYYFTLDNLDAGVERFTRLGGSIDVPAMEVPGGDRIAIGRDAQGARVALHENNGS